MNRDQINLPADIAARLRGFCKKHHIAMSCFIERALDAAESSGPQVSSNVEKLSIAPRPRGRALFISPSVFVGEKRKQLTCVAAVPPDKSHSGLWELEVQCDCGVIINIRPGQFGVRASCGCARRLWGDNPS